MTKLGLVLCLAFVVCHSTSAYGVWAQYSNGDIQQVASQLQYAPAVSEQYYQNVDVQQQPQQQVDSSAELLNQQPQSTNYGTKGIGGFANRPKSNQQTPQLAFVPFYDGQNDFQGYIDAQANFPSNPNLTTTNKQPRSRLRSFLPWNWVFTSSTTETVNAPQEGVQQPILAQPQKRLWPFGLFSRRSYPSRQPVACQCWPQSLGYDYTNAPINEHANTYQPPGEQQQQSNVRLVNPNEDQRGLESNVNRRFIQAPISQQPQISQPVQIQIPSQLAQQVPNQLPQVSHLDVTGQNEQTIPQQAAPQQVIYPTNGGTSANLNSQSIPSTNNFQSSAGDVVQNSQTHSSK